MLRKGRIPVTDVNPHLLCVLCGGYFIDATTIIECLHSYCRTCIVRYLETSKMCPLCDVLVHKTKPLENLRADKTLQDLVYKLVPGLFESEMTNRRKFYSEHPKECKTASLEERGDACMEKTGDSEAEQISLVLELSANGRPPGVDKSDSKLTDRRYLLCPSAVTVGHLKKFIRLKFAVPTKYQIQFYHTRLELSENLTLCDISTLYTWRRTQPLKLFYMMYNPPPNRYKLPPKPEDRRRRLSMNKNKPDLKRKSVEDLDIERAAKIAKKGASSGSLLSDFKTPHALLSSHHEKSDSMYTITRDVNENCVIRQSKDIKHEVASNDLKCRPCASKDNVVSKQTSLFIKPNSPLNGKHKLHRNHDFFSKSKFGKLDIYAKNSKKSKNSDSSKLLNDNKLVDGMKLLKINKNGDVFKCPIPKSSLVASPVSPGEKRKEKRSVKSLIRPGKNIKVNDVTSHDVKSDENKDKVIIDINRSVTNSPFKFLDTKNTVLVQCSLKKVSAKPSTVNSDESVKSECKRDVMSKQTSDKAAIKACESDDKSDVKLKPNKVEKSDTEFVHKKDDKSAMSAKSKKNKNTCVSVKDVDIKTDDVSCNNRDSGVNSIAKKANDKIVVTATKDKVYNKKKYRTKNSINDIFKITEDNHGVLSQHKTERTEKAEVTEPAIVTSVNQSKVSTPQNSKTEIVTEEANISKDVKTQETNNYANIQQLTTPVTSPAPPCELLLKPRMKKSDFFARQRSVPKAIYVPPEDNKTEAIITPTTDNIEQIGKVQKFYRGVSESMTNKMNDVIVKPEKYLEERLDANKNDVNVKVKDNVAVVAVNINDNKNDVVNTNDVVHKNDVNLNVTNKKKNDVTVVKGRCSKTDTKVAENKNGVDVHPTSKVNCSVSKNASRGKTESEEIDDSALCHHNSLIFQAGFATDPYSFDINHQPLDLSEVNLKRCVKKSMILNK